MQNAQESFARTMLQLIAQRAAAHAAATTTQLMMTTALKELYAFLDVWEVDDNGNVTDAFKAANPKLTITVGGGAGAHPDQRDARSDEPQLHALVRPGRRHGGLDARRAARSDPIVYPASAGTLHYLLYGSLDGLKDPNGGRHELLAGRRQRHGAAAPGERLHRLDDGHDPPARPPARRRRRSTTCRRCARRTSWCSTSPRVGFFSTPAFAANWQTNTSNTMRVTTNQTFIVALGAMVDGTDTTTPPGTPGLDTAHAAPGRVLPAATRSSTRRGRSSSATYSWNYHSQIDSDVDVAAGHVRVPGRHQAGAEHRRSRQRARDAPALRARRGCRSSATTQLVALRPERPRVPADRLATSRARTTRGTRSCSELLSSPHHRRTRRDDGDRARRTARSSPSSRRDHLCAALNARLGFTDVCGLDAHYAKETA